MVESESTALPLGDAPKSNNIIISYSERFVKYFLNFSENILSENGKIMHEIYELREKILKFQKNSKKYLTKQNKCDIII